MGELIGELINAKIVTELHGQFSQEVLHSLDLDLRESLPLCRFIQFSFNIFEQVTALLQAVEKESGILIVSIKYPVKQINNITAASFMKNKDNSNLR